MNLDLTSSVLEYCDLQTRLLRALSWKVELVAERFYNDVAQGEVALGADVWTFRGHGGGIRFERAGITVDAHVAPHIHCAVDAWRIELYLDSIQAPAGSSDSPLEHVLEQMVATRRLAAVDVSLGETSCRMYVPSFAPSNGVDPEVSWLCVCTARRAR